MTQSGSQAAAWRRDVQEHKAVWTVEDDSGIPAPLNREGRRVIPFWSSRNRVEKIIASVPAYADFRPLRLGLDEFQSQWLDGLEQDGLLIGINWSGANASGYDVEPSDVRDWLAAK